MYPLRTYYKQDWREKLLNYGECLLLVWLGFVILAPLTYRAIDIELRQREKEAARILAQKSDEQIIEDFTTYKYAPALMADRGQQ